MGKGNRHGTQTKTHTKVYLEEGRENQFQNVEGIGKPDSPFLTYTLLVCGGMGGVGVRGGGGKRDFRTDLSSSSLLGLNYRHDSVM